MLRALPSEPHDLVTQRSDFVLGLGRSDRPFMRFDVLRRSNEATQQMPAPRAAYPSALLATWWQEHRPENCYGFSPNRRGDAAGPEAHGGAAAPVGVACPGRSA